VGKSKEVRTYYCQRCFDNICEQSSDSEPFGCVIDPSRYSRWSTELEVLPTYHRKELMIPQYNDRFTKEASCGR
jgi:hypothetical protein